MRHFIWLLVIAGLAFIPASIAKSKGYSFAGFYVFGFFFFIISLIVAVCLQDRSDYIPRYEAEAMCRNEQPALNKLCRKCGAYINKEDTFCRKCGADQAEADSESYADIPAGVTEQDEKAYNINDIPVSDSGCISCPACGTVQRADRKLLKMRCQIHLIIIIDCLIFR